jgi:hypothetical protein
MLMTPSEHAIAVCSSPALTCFSTSSDRTRGSFELDVHCGRCGWHNAVPTPSTVMKTRRKRRTTCEVNHPAEAWPRANVFRALEVAVIAVINVGTMTQCTQERCSMCQAAVMRCILNSSLGALEGRQPPAPPLLRPYPHPQQSSATPSRGSLLPTSKLQRMDHTTDHTFVTVVTTSDEDPIGVVKIICSKSFV